jgi:hypothetical protein
MCKYTNHSHRIKLPFIIADIDNYLCVIPHTQSDSPLTLERHGAGGFSHPSPASQLCVWACLDFDGSFIRTRTTVPHTPRLLYRLSSLVSPYTKELLTEDL